MTFELSETATEHIHMPENLYRQRGREEVGWGEREGGSGLWREGERKWVGERGREEVGCGEREGGSGLGREGGRKWVGEDKEGETDKDAERKGRREVKRGGRGEQVVSGQWALCTALHMQHRSDSVRHASSIAWHCPRLTHPAGLQGMYILYMYTCAADRGPLQRPGGHGSE